MEPTQIALGQNSAHQDRIFQIGDEPASLGQVAAVLQGHDTADGGGVARRQWLGQGNLGIAAGHAAPRPGERGFLATPA